MEDEEFERLMNEVGVKEEAATKETADKEESK